MKIVKILLQFLRWVVFSVIVLFSLATILNKSYLQTAVFLLIAITIAYWPTSISKKWNHKIYMISRIGFLLILILVKMVFIKSEPKTTIYTSEENQIKLMAIYDEKVLDWPQNTEDIYLETQYGKVHVLACGSKQNPPLLMFHAASMGAHSWADNLEPLLTRYRIYAVDNIGEGNKSKLNNALIYPNTPKEIADFNASIANQLGIDSSPVFGASNGGYIAQIYAYYYPEKVRSLALFGPMGITKLTGKSIFMLGFASMYPLQTVRNYVAKWAIGEDEYINQKYGDWFNTIMKATIPSVAQPVPMTTKQKQQMNLPVLLFLGTKDKIVGNAEVARQKALEYPDIQIEILESGHLIAVEKANLINRKIIEFLKTNP